MASAKPTTPINVLRALYLDALIAKHQTVPLEELQSLAKTKNWKHHSTNGMTGAIIDYVTYTGGFANRISSAGRKIKTKSDKEIYIKGTTKSGTPDISAVYNGLSINIECKNENTKDRVSAAQNSIMSQLQAAGAITFIAKSFDSFFYWYNENILKQKAA